jgi:hypothetical protein
MPGVQLHFNRKRPGFYAVELFTGRSLAGGITSIGKNSLTGDPPAISYQKSD